MASQLPPSPPPTRATITGLSDDLHGEIFLRLPALPSPPPTPTTITGLSDDLLREIFLRLPALPSLARAAFACRAFRRAVRSSPAFRRSFRALHAPPVLALFLEPNFEVVPSFPCRRDPDVVAADFFGIRLPRQPTGWEIQSHNPSADGYLILDKGTLPSTSRRAAYNPLTQALDLHIFFYDLQLYTLPSEDGQGPSRVVCVIRELSRWPRERDGDHGVAVFSSDTMEWRFLPKNTMPPCVGAATTGTAMRGLIWWPNWTDHQIGVLDTTIFQFSLVGVPAPLMTECDEPTYKLGETKDEKLCIVDIKDNTLICYSLRAEDDSVVERWMLYREFPLDPIVEQFTGCSIEEEGSQVRVHLVALIDGFVYLSIFYCKDTQSCELYLSLCLETSERSELFKDAYRHNKQVHPYVMAWPPSLLQSKEESENESTGDTVADDGPLGNEKTPSVLVAALQSLSQTLMDGGDSNKEIVAQLDTFLRPNVDGEGSLMSKVTSLDAQLVTARDRILRIST